MNGAAPLQYLDFQGMSALREQARAQDPEAAKAVAEQFEAMLLQMVLKSMRDALPGDALVESSGLDMYQDLFDKQLAIDMAASGSIGLAEQLLKQISYEKPGLDQSKVESGTTETNFEFPGVHPFLIQPELDTRKQTMEEASASLPAAELARDGQTLLSQPGGASKAQPKESAFVNRLLPFARKAAAMLGLEPGILIAQAALETGWGKSLLAGDGISSLFGIKADSAWGGEAVTALTKEYVGGQPELVRAKFRSYAGLEDAFDGYVDFLKKNDRYKAALDSTGSPEGFVNALQQAGYATDPKYASKILAIYSRDSFQKLVGESL